MDIVLATDNNFIKHCCVTITSILCNNNNVNVYIITEGLLPENENILKAQTEKFGGTFHVALVNKMIIAQLPMPKTAAQHISPATYYRLFVCELLPENVDKIIYLDCDIVVRGNLEPFWNTDVENRPLAAVYQRNSWAESTYKGRISSYKRLDMKGAAGYFNAGSLLINLKYWRENSVQSKLLSFMRSHYEKIISHDQDILNGCLYKEVLPVSNIWNFRLPMNPEYYGKDFISTQEIKEITKSAVVIHFVNRPKPWEFACNHPYVKEYYKYLDMTPFAGWRPAFSFKCIYKYCVRPLLVDIKHLADKVLKTGIYNKRNYERI